MGGTGSGAERAGRGHSNDGVSCCLKSMVFPVGSLNSLPTMGTPNLHFLGGYNGYNHILGGLKPSFFHGFLGSKGR